jgi:KDO2-lipid IV(A) lauroyltransferase
LAAAGLRDWLEYLLARLLIGSLRIGGLPLARIYARAIDRLVPKLRRVAETNLRLTGFPEAITDGVFESIARLIHGFARLPSITRTNVDGWIEYEGFEHFEEAKRRGRGVLFATAHLGNWELSAYAHALLTEPMYVVVRPLDNPLLDRFVTRRRSGSGNTILGKKDLLRTVVKALAANRAVGILIDQNSLLNEGVFVDFFGVPACVNASFAKLAHRTGAAVIPGFALWDAARGRYVLKFLPIVDMTGDGQADSQRLHSILESVIREYPDQWLWVHRRWKTRPPGSPPIY